MKNLIVTLVFVIVAVACNEKKKTMAKIFERKEISENNLMIKYAFVADKKIITDSTIIKNQPINSDSITISYDQSNPQNHTPQVAR